MKKILTNHNMTSENLTRKGDQPLEKGDQEKIKETSQETPKESSQEAPRVRMQSASTSPKDFPRLSIVKVSEKNPSLGQRLAAADLDTSKAGNSDFTVDYAELLSLNDPSATQAYLALAKDIKASTWWHPGNLLKAFTRFDLDKVHGARANQLLNGTNGLIQSSTLVAHLAGASIKTVLAPLQIGYGGAKCLTGMFGCIAAGDGNWPWETPIHLMLSGLKSIGLGVLGLYNAPLAAVLNCASAIKDWLDTAQAARES